MYIFCVHMLKTKDLIKNKLQAPLTCLLNDFIGNSQISQCTILGRNGDTVKTLMKTSTAASQVLVVYISDS